MTNRPKKIGTAAESAVVAAATSAGLTATRVALAGVHDQGDVHLAYGRVVIEVKGGKAAATASMALIRAWWEETDREAARVPRCDLAVLIVKRAGKGRARDWRAFTTIGDYGHLCLDVDPASWASPARLIEMAFGDLLDDLAVVL